MKLNSNLMTAISPSSFGMPVRAHAFMTTGAFGADGGSATTFVVRERQAAEAGLGLAIAYVPGTIAWRPPSS